MNNSSPITILIVNFNGSAYIRKCLESFKDQQNPSCRIIVIDNGSQDDSPSIVANEYSDIELVRMPENNGYGAAINEGLKRTSSEIVVIANNDLFIDSHWSQKIYKAFSGYKKCGQIASKVLYWDEPQRINSAGTLIYSDLTAVNKGLDEIDNGQYDQVQEVFGAYGAIIAFRRCVFETIGYFDEEYFLFKEEDDITLRMRRAGWSSLFIPEAKVYHKRSANTKMFSPLKLYYSERNRIWNVMKHLSLHCVITTLPAVLLRYLANFSTGLGKSSRKGKAMAKARKVTLVFTIFHAWISAFKEAPVMLKRRKEYQKWSALKYRDVRKMMNNYKAILEHMTR